MLLCAYCGGFDSAVSIGDFLVACPEYVREFRLKECVLVFTGKCNLLGYAILGLGLIIKNGPGYAYIPCLFRVHLIVY